MGKLHGGLHSTHTDDVEKHPEGQDGAASLRKVGSPHQYPTLVSGWCLTPSETVRDSG